MASALSNKCRSIPISSLARDRRIPGLFPAASFLKLLSQLLFIFFCFPSSPLAPQTQLLSPKVQNSTSLPGDGTVEQETKPAREQEGTTLPVPPRKGLRLVESFFPLKVGNRWTYAVEINGKKRPKPVVVEIIKMVIKNFRSYYLFNRFPFAPGPVTETPIIRFDRKQQAFVQLVNDQEVELYPEQGENPIELKPGESATGQVDLRILRAEFRPTEPGFQPTSVAPPDQVVFKYGEGILSARRTTQLGVEQYTLLKSEQNQFGSNPVTPPKAPVAEQGTLPPLGPVSPYATAGPVLTLEVVPSAGKVRFTLRVGNEKDKMIPLNFDNDQSFDFIITSDSSNQPVWRWSSSHYFARVKRSIGLLPGESREFSGEWSGLDSDHQPVPPGKYFVIGVLTTSPELRTPPKEFNFTPVNAR